MDINGDMLKKSNYIVTVSGTPIGEYNDYAQAYFAASINFESGTWTISRT